jgi:PAS domain S-box-containing protein
MPAISTKSSAKTGNSPEYRLFPVPRHPAATLFEFLPDVHYFVKNKRSEFIDANQGFVEMMGVHRLDEILGKTDHDFSPRELADHFVRDDRKVMETGKPITNVVELVPDSDGSINWHVTTKVPVHDEHGRISGIAGFTRDLKKASVSLKRYGSMTSVVDYVFAHYADPITVSDLAGLVHLSVSQFERRFKALFHMTPMQYLVKHRINKACQILTSTDTKITEIAASCGFYDHSHFIRLFTKTIGTSPHDFRKQHRQ